MVQPDTNRRLLSLDALRGFDMFWLMAGGGLIRTLAKATQWPWLQTITAQTHHVDWHGLAGWDLIFPLFMFISGVSIPYAILGKLEKGFSSRRLLFKIIMRALLLVILGWIYQGFLTHGFNGLRFASVLGQIGIAYGVAAVSVLYLRDFKRIVIVLLVVSVLVTLIHFVIPVPGHGAGVLTKEGCMNAYLDQNILPGKMYRETYDPQGVLCMLSAIALPIMGALTGLLLRGQRFNGYKKTGIMAGAGVALILGSLAIHPFYPINKEIWTIPFDFFTAGISLILLSCFYLVIDVWHLQKWSFFFRVIGMNAITIYMGKRIINFGYTSKFLFGGVAGWFDQYEAFVMVIASLACQWLFLYILYHKKIFLRV
jgi:predicted acyltransferase